MNRYHGRIRIMKNKNIDKESQRFITSSIKFLKDAENFNLTLGSIKAALAGACTIEKRKQFLEKLEAKLIKGSLEHGKPMTDFKQIDKELFDEILDLFGYLMLRYYAFKNQCKKL